MAKRIRRLEESLDQVVAAQDSQIDLMAEFHNDREEVAHSDRKHLRRGFSQLQQLFTKYRTERMQRLVNAGLPQNRATHILQVEVNFSHKQNQEIGEQPSQVGELLAQRAGARGIPEGQERSLRELLKSELSRDEFHRYVSAVTGEYEFLIVSVQQGSNAESAGLQPGDRIVSYHGVPLLDMLNFHMLFDSTSPGQQVEIGIRRSSSTAIQHLNVPSGPLGIEVTARPAAAPASRN